jgi:hypothetical protein
MDMARCESSESDVDQRFKYLLEASSLGTPAAGWIRSCTPSDIVEDVRLRVMERRSSQILPGHAASIQVLPAGARDDVLLAAGQPRIKESAAAAEQGIQVGPTEIKSPRGETVVAGSTAPRDLAGLADTQAAFTRLASRSGTLPAGRRPDPGTVPPCGPRGSRRSTRRRRLVAAGSAAVLCAAAVAAGLYLTGHISGQDSRNVDTNTVQHLSSPAATQTHQASQSPRSTPTPTPSVRPSAAVPNPSGNSQPTKSVNPQRPLRAHRGPARPPR